MSTPVDRSAAKLINGSQTPGVYRLINEPAQIATVLNAAGWVTATLMPAASTTDFYREIAVVLSFPDYFGHNLDALADCLSEIHRPTAVILRGWTTLATARPRRWPLILAVLEERTTQQPPFAVILA